MALKCVEIGCDSTTGMCHPDAVRNIDEYIAGVSDMDMTERARRRLQRRADDKKAAEVKQWQSSIGNRMLGQRDH